MDCGKKILASMARGFCSRLKNCQTSDAGPLLERFLNDSIDLNVHSFWSVIPVSEVLEQHLVLVLLQQGSFHTLKDFFSLRPDYVESPMVQSSIVSFVQGAMDPSSLAPTQKFTSQNIGAVELAIQCQNILEPVFPVLKQQFDTSRRFLDVIHFMQNVLQYNASIVPSAASFNRTTGLSVVQSVLKNKPDSIIIECPSWGQEEFAAQANFNISSRKKGNKVDDLPPPPGGPILHLASLLGLGEPRSQFVVKNHIVLYAVESGLYGAAVALCSLLLHDALLGDSTGIEIDPDSGALLLESVSAVVANDSYTDFRTRKELCIDCLNWCKPAFIRNCGKRSFDNILRAYPYLEKGARNEGSQSVMGDDAEKCRNETYDPTVALEHEWESRTTENIEQFISSAQICTTDENSRLTLKLILTWCINQAANIRGGSKQVDCSTHARTIEIL